MRTIGVSPIVPRMLSVNRRLDMDQRPLTTMISTLVDTLDLSLIALLGWPPLAIAISLWLTEWRGLPRGQT